MTSFSFWPNYRTLGENWNFSNNGSKIGRKHQPQLKYFALEMSVQVRRVIRQHWIELNLFPLSPELNISHAKIGDFSYSVRQTKASHSIFCRLNRISGTSIISILSHPRMKQPGWLVQETHPVRNVERLTAGTPRHCAANGGESRIFL